MEIRNIQFNSMSAKSHLIMFFAKCLTAVKYLHISPSKSVCLFLISNVVIYYGTSNKSSNHSPSTYMD